MRSQKTILDAEEHMFDLVAYDRKLTYLDRIRAGLEEMAPEDIMDGMTGFMRQTEEKYGVDNLGPYTDFEWGMINGKLSALRWVLGEDWDMLDT